MESLQHSLTNIPLCSSKYFKVFYENSSTGVQFIIICNATCEKPESKVLVLVKILNILLEIPVFCLELQ